MKYHRRISLVIPTLNEAQNLGFLLGKIPKYVDEIVVVDGYSNDQTVEIAKKFGCKVYYDKVGKGSALVKGANSCKGDFLVMMDADLSHRPVELSHLIKGLAAGYDICMGSRFMKGGGSSDISLVRKAGNKFFVLLVNTFFGSSYTDLCYGYRSFKRNAFRKLTLRSEGFSIETEISIKAAKNRMKILEIPSFEKKRQSGEGKLKTFSDGFTILKIIFKEVLKR